MPVELLKSSHEAPKALISKYDKVRSAGIEYTMQYLEIHKMYMYICIQ